MHDKSIDRYSNESRNVKFRCCTDCYRCRLFEEAAALEYDVIARRTVARPDAGQTNQRAVHRAVRYRPRHTADLVAVVVHRTRGNVDR